MKRRISGYNLRSLGTIIRKGDQRIYRLIERSQTLNHIQGKIEGYLLFIYFRNVIRFGRLVGGSTAASKDLDRRTRRRFAQASVRAQLSGIELYVRYLRRLRHEFCQEVGFCIERVV